MELLDYEKLKVQIGESNSANKFVIVYYTMQDEKINILATDENLTYKKYLESLNIKKAVQEAQLYLEDGEQQSAILLYIDNQVKDNDVLNNNAIKAGAAAFRRIATFDKVEVSLASEIFAYETVLGFVLASYNYNFLKKASTDDSKQIFINSSLEPAKKAVNVGNAQNFTRFMGDTPANLMNPTLFSEYGKSYLENKANVSISVYTKNFMEEKKMNLLLGVSQGSVQEPKLFHATYRGKSSKDVDIALVGKGVTFDAGGISLKPSLKMADMKGDMLGGASVLSTFGLICDKKLPINVDLIIPLVENLPSGSATKPGDVHVGMSGKSVEIDNTDAEGRLILADALTFAQTFKPKYIVDVATLTGAMIISLGDAYIGYFCNDDEFADLIKLSGTEASDPVWRMPLSAMYTAKATSLVADIKNIGGRAGGSAVAASFLNEFIEEGVKWAHLDIAGVMNDSSDTVVYGPGMTGRSVGTLVNMVENLSAKLN